MLSPIKYTVLLLLSALLVGCGGGGGGSTTAVASDTQASDTPTETTTSDSTTTTTSSLPVALSKTVLMEEDTIESITLESDADSDATYEITTLPLHGTLVGTPPHLIYVPEGNFNSTDTFKFTVTTSEGTSTPATIEIHASDLPEPANNIAPTSVDYNVVIDEDMTTNLPLVAVDPNGDTLTFKVINGPFYGTYDLKTNIYTPNTDFNGTDSFKYIANDGTADSNESKIIITVLPVNDMPLAYDINITTDEDSAKKIILKGTDRDGDTLYYTIAKAPGHGTYDLNTETYTPAANFNGTDTFTYVANDGTVNSAEATVTVTVNALNDAPTADSLTLTTDEDTPLNIILSGSDEEGNDLTFTVVTPPQNGSFDGTQYTPNTNFNGTDSFTYIANDGELNSTEATVSITVVSLNDIPVADDKNITLEEDTSVTITLSGSDADNDTLSYTYTQPSHGNFDGSTYTPDENFYGTDSFTYVANDGEADSPKATVTITVTSSNDVPVANDQNLTTNINTALDITLSGTDADSDDTLTYTIVHSPEHGTLTGTAPNLTYTPNEDYTGEDSFTFTVNDGTSDSNEATVSINISSDTVTVHGTITYDLVPGVADNSSGYKLDYTQTVQKPVRYVIVELIDASDNVLYSTTTDSNGSYSFSGIDNNTDVKVRVSAKMFRTDTPSWDVKVVDNTNSDALYVMEGSLASTGTSTEQIRDLNAPSGWDGSSYATERTAAPFAILDDLYATIETILSAEPEAAFPTLQVNWSVNNVATWGDTSRGQIGTSHYTNGNLFILGDADNDTDEYDNHVITHEWGHYYEDKFSRSDSIGGSHSDGDILDIRVAFGEGWGNAFSAISLKDPIYFDTYGSSQASGWSMDMDKLPQNNPGWFSESSVQRIIYDIWDSNNEPENDDTLTLGFGPIHQVMTGAEKETPAFTSLFTFITNLKDENSNDATAIDDIVANESIATIDDIFGGLSGGTARTNHPDDYPYAETSVNGTAANVETATDYGTYNGLTNRVYVKFTIPSDGEYHIKIQQTNGDDSDPDYKIYALSPFTYIGSDQGSDKGIEEGDFTLNEGDYLLDIYDASNISSAQFDVTVTQ
jgi:hypothetical protein